MTRSALALALGLCCSALAAAQDTAGHDVTALAKTTQNPVGDLVSLPFQFNFNTGGGLEERTALVLNVQPVMPFVLTSNWNVILRTIVPIVSSPGPAGTRFSGLGDFQTQIFFTPAKPGSFIWGAGPVVSLPTATSSSAETGSWGVGPAGVIVKMTGPWVLGSLFTQLWAMADEGGDPEINQFLWQPFVNYNLERGWALSFSPIITANWNDEQEWTVPLGMGITKTAVFNGRPMNLGVNYYYNVEHPDGAAGQQVRFVLSLLYPKKP